MKTDPEVHEILDELLAQLGPPVQVVFNTKENITKLRHIVQTWNLILKFDTLGMSLGNGKHEVPAARGIINGIQFDPRFLLNIIGYAQT